MFRLLLILPILCVTSKPSEFLDFASKCTKWVKTNGSDCPTTTAPSTYKFSVGNFTPSFDNNVCCDDGTGCFTIEGGSPFECHNHLPKCMSVVKPQFFFYTPAKKQEVQMIDYLKLNDSAKRVIVEPIVKPFFVIVHGFGGDWPKDWMFNMKDRLVNLDNNVMIVRWTGGAKDPMYFSASANTRTVGAAIAQVVKALDANKKISIVKTTIIGFSLGGQISGFAGSNIPKLARILAIDPAGPMFQCMPPEARLDPTDAQFVQAIHTNGDLFLMGGCGTLQQFGHMDVYMNGGSQQPGCPRGTMQSFKGMSSLNFGGMVESVSCSHNRVPKLMVEIIELAADPQNKCQYVGFPCNSVDDWKAGKCFKCPAEGCPNVGYLTDLASRRSGKFYVNTMADNETTGSYCGRQALITIQGAVKVHGNITVAFKIPNGNDSITIIQNIDDYLNVGESKGAVAVVPFKNFPIPNEAEVTYFRNTKWMAGGPAHWKMTSLSFQLINGTRFENRDGVDIKDGESKMVQLRKALSN